MEVELYVYDLSRGMARQFSHGFTGIHIDAIYHTAIVLNGVEYFFGQGIHRKIPGSTHHGRPMEIVKMGKTDLPMDLIEEYVQSLESVYTPESYDLFLNNCNNFTEELSVFLVGKRIPEHITGLPERFLQTPMGQMLRTQLDQSMRQMTQAPDAYVGQSVSNSRQPTAPAPNGSSARSIPSRVNGIGPRKTNGQKPSGKVHHVTTLHELDSLLKSARHTCAVIFFTSTTCPPCKIVYPAYDGLAAEAGEKVTLIKVDIGQAYEIGARYQVRATPTFITFRKGKQQSLWSGADENRLVNTVGILIESASPPYLHSRLRLPTLQRKIAVEDAASFPKVPPLKKLKLKIAAANPQWLWDHLIKFIEEIEEKGPDGTASFDHTRVVPEIAPSLAASPLDTHFALIDLIRCAASYQLTAGSLIEEERLTALNSIMPVGKDWLTAPYNIQVVTLQLACNLFDSESNALGLTGDLEEHLVKDLELRSMLEHLASSCLLASHQRVRLLAAGLVYNLVTTDHNRRLDGKADYVRIDEMHDIQAALVEAVLSEKESKETLHALLLALGLLMYGSPDDSNIWELFNAMDVKGNLKQKMKNPTFKNEPLLKELAVEFFVDVGGSFDPTRATIT